MGLSSNSEGHRVLGDDLKKQQNSFKGQPEFVKKV